MIWGRISLQSRHVNQLRNQAPRHAGGNAPVRSLDLIYRFAPRMTASGVSVWPGCGSQVAPLSAIVLGGALLGKARLLCRGTCPDEGKCPASYG
jgi:hypothetical protein